MADDARRAEIEAVARLLYPYDWSPAGLESDRDRTREHAAELLAELDRVRDARGNEEAAQVVLDRMIDAAARAGAGGVLPAETVRQECLRVTYALGSARSPQDEDHETIRPEQPPSDKLGGQPPAEPKTP